MDANDSKIIVTYQGAFSPPTMGHKDGARKLLLAAIKLHPTSDITLLFMPSNDAESKTSLNKRNYEKNIAESLQQHYMSFAERFECLTLISTELIKESEFNLDNIHIKVSDIEQKFVEIDPPITGKTICTLMVLKKNYPESTIYLGIGSDNMANIIDWAHSLAVPYSADTADPDTADPIIPAQLKALIDKGSIDESTGEYYFKDYIAGILVLDRKQEYGQLVSDANSENSIDGITGTVININGLNYKSINSTLENPIPNKPIPIVRSQGWGRIDIVEITNKIITDSYPMPIYLLDAPEPAGISSSKVRTKIINGSEVNYTEVPAEVLDSPIFTTYKTRLSTTNGGKRKKYSRKRNKITKKKKFAKHMKKLSVRKMK
jgi:nicotinic acid mononucleotide adenylyltransferase